MEEIKEQNFDNWKIGLPNSTGAIIKHIFHRKESHYIIYESEVSTLVSYKTNPDLNYLNKILKFEKELSLIKGLVNKKQRKKFTPRVASALKCCFEDETEVTSGILDDVINSISKYKSKIGQLEYLTGFAICGLLTIFIYLFFSCFNICGTEMNSLIFNTILFGILGGFLSISTKLKKITIDVESASTSMHIVTGASRILISMISSILVFYLIDSGLIIKNLLNESNKESIIYVFAALSGFSEMWIPNILDKIGKSTTSEIKT